MPKDKKQYHENFIEYVEFVTSHPAYKGLPIKKTKTASRGFVATKKSKIGKSRKQWIEDKAVELGYPIDKGVYAKVMREIHPTKYTVCQICGRSLSVFYHYPNKDALKSIAKKFGVQYSIVDHISDIWDDLIDKGFDHNSIASFFLKKCSLHDSAEELSKEEIIDKLEDCCRNKGYKLLGPGAMSNAPDRFDGFHSYNRCCRKKEDRGRWDSNMDTYNQDRRAYENWSDGNIRAANKYMHSPVFSGTSADHIGPISLGFVHDSVYLQAMPNGDNSAKRDRLTEEDIEKIISIEERTGISPVSWYVQSIWEYIKANYKVESEKIENSYRNMMKQNVTNYMFLLFRIVTMCGDKGKETLTELFLDPHKKDYKYDYEFNECGEITERKPRHKTESSIGEFDRHKRIAFEAIIEFNEKNNRKVKPDISEETSESINAIIELINASGSKDNIKAAILRTMETMQNECLQKLRN